MIHAQAAFVEAEEHCREPRDSGKLWYRLFGLLVERVSESGCLCRREEGCGVWRDPECVNDGCGQLLSYASVFVFCASNRLRAMRAGGIVCLDAPRAAPRPAGRRSWR